MDGRKPTLRNLLVATLALAGHSAALHADDFIRQPARQPAPTQLQAASDSSGRSAQPAAAKLDAITAAARIAEPGARVQAFTASATQSIPGNPRQALAAEISTELSADRLASGRAGVTVASSLEPGPGWQAIGEELREHVGNCERLLSRGAHLSAMEESRRGIVRLIRVLDLRQNKMTSEPAWAQAQQALREALEFTTHERIAGDCELFTRIIRSHETPALHGANVTGLTPLAAAQHYRAYAERCLVEASQGHPWFGELYYCMGRALESQAAAGAPQADALLLEAVTYYRSARTIQPSNATTANQLAYVLLRLDRPSEAMTQLAAVVRDPNCPLEAWQNLVEASSRVHDRSTEQWALQNYMALKQRGAAPSGQSGTLVELDPKQFAAMSPYTSGPQTQTQSQPQSQNASPSAAPAQGEAASPATRTAAGPKTGWFR